IAPKTNTAPFFGGRFLSIFDLEFFPLSDRRFQPQLLLAVLDVARGKRASRLNQMPLLTVGSRG
ncbi:hypothetical protein, partial [Sphingomonas zeae]|uniref:hypothetical protein n=1 Tax=Sphingomonas zeae TaxID=1646122 RepID=UPI001C310E1A